MAALKTTFDHYIKNPAIVGTSTIQYNLLKDNYSARFDTTLVREGGELKYKLYKDEDGNRYIHMKVPSEVVPNFFYDVIIEFIDSSLLSVLPTLSKNNVKFYSNDPAFVFNYAYAFNKNGLLIDSLKSKLPKEALENRAIVRNPRSNIGPIKSFYFCYFYMEMKNLFLKIKWTDEATLKKNTFNATVKNAADKIDERIRLGKQISKQEPDHKPKPSIDREKSYTSKNVKFSKKAQKVVKAKTAKVVKTAKKVKSIKPISKAKKK